MMDDVRLRALTYADLPLTLEWHNQPEIVDMYSGHPFPVNEEMEKKWYDKITGSNIPTTVFGVEHVSDSRLIGITLLKDINFVNSSAETAIYIGDTDYRGKGMSIQAMRLTLDFAFSKLNLHRAWLRVRSDNLPAIRLYKRIGFCEEGVLREAEYKNGVYLDIIILSILKHEYPLQKAQTS